MIKSIGGKKLDTAVFISGNGSNLKNLIKFSLGKKSPINIKFVLSNNKIFSKKIQTICYWKNCKKFRKSKVEWKSHLVKKKLQY